MSTYSVYEAKAKFSEIIRNVRAGRTVRVSFRGEPVAEIRPLPAAAESLSERLDGLERRGALVRPSAPQLRSFAPLATRAGALERFLAERGE